MDAIVDLQIEYSLASRGPEARIFPELRELGISATLYGVLSRGLLAGRAPTEKGDFRAYLPRFTSHHRAQNEAAVAALARFATERNRTPGQIAIAWARAKQPALLPLIGAKNRAQLDDALSALDQPLPDAEVAELDALFPPGTIGGDRYGAEQMRVLDSER